MKKRLLFFACLFLGLTTVKAQLSQKFETKVSATPIVTSASNGEVAIYAGAKRLNVIQLSDGKMVLDKTYKEAGSSVEKAFDGVISAAANRLVICDKKNVLSCIDLASGKKVWETTSFTELDHGGDAIDLCGNHVMVSDKKGKENFALSCVDLNSGKVLWTVENEKERVAMDNTINLSASNLVGVFTKGKKDQNQFRLINLDNGKTEMTTPLEGQPIFSLIDPDYLFIHHHVAEDQSYVSAFNLSEKRLQWKAKASNKSPHLPWTMNAGRTRYYATIQRFDDKVMLKTAGLEVFDLASGRPLYNVPYIPYYKWGVGHYTNGIFEPRVTPAGILMADGTEGELYLKLIDKQTGKPIWSTEKLKNRKCAPEMVMSDNVVTVQYGGLNYFEVINNSGIGKLLDPFTVTAYDLRSGKMLWNIESKKDFYKIEPIGENNLMIVGTKELQTVELKTGNIVKTEKNPFKESYFMTTGGIANLKLQKNVIIDFSKRISLLYQDEKLSKCTF